MYQTLLTPIDGSDEALNAAQHAIDLAAGTDADLHVLYVMESKPSFTRVGYSGLEDEIVNEEHAEYAQNHLDEVAEKAAERDVPCSTEIKTGTPHSKILEYATDIQADAIVMGAHGHDWGGVEQMVLGSTTDRVNRNATVPVLTVR